MSKKITALILAIFMCLQLCPIAFAAEAPTIVKITPADGYEGLNPIVDTTDVTFSCDIDENTVNTSTIIIDSGTIINIKKLSSNKFRLFYNNLKLGTKHTLTFKNAIKSVDGVNLKETKKTFTTMYDFPLYNQILNSDMENPDLKNIYTDAGAKSITFVKENSNTILYNRMGWTDARISQSIYIEGGKKYEARAMVKSSISQQVWYNLAYKTVADSSTWYHASNKQTLPANEWVELKAVFSVPAEALDESYFPQIEICAKTMGSYISIDDWKFYEEGYDLDAPISSVNDDLQNDKILTVAQNDDIDKNAQKLAALGVYSGANYKTEDAQVTREDFAEYIASFMGNRKINMSEFSGKYNDINPNVYEGYAGVCAFYDLLKPDQMGNFNPNSYISCEEALRAVIIALGYKVILETKSISQCASDLGLTKGFTPYMKKWLKYKDLSCILTNALETKVMITDKKSAYISDRYAYEENLSLKKDIGIVDATEITGLWTSEPMKNGYVSISGVKYKVEGLDPGPYLGLKSEFYTVENGGKECVVYLGELDEYNTVVTLDPFDTEYEPNKYIYYYKDSKTKKYNLSKEKYFIYNGKALNDFSDADYVPDYGKITLIDNNGDNLYDVVQVTDYEVVIVEAFDEANGIIIGKSTSEPIKLDPNGNIKVFESGVARKFSSILPDNILTIVRSKDGEYAEIYKSTNFIEGEICCTGVENARQYVEFYDEVHGPDVVTRVNVLNVGNGLQNLKAGVSGVLRIDYFGNAVDFTKKSLVDKLGYITKIDLGNGIENKLKLRIFTENNEFSEYSAAKKISIDSVGYSIHKQAYDYLMNSNETFSGELVKYTLNGNGEVTKITTTRDTVSNDLRKIAAESDATYSSLCSLSNAVIIDNNTKTFIVPSDAENDKPFMYGYYEGKQYYISGKKYSYTAYSLDDDNLSADVIVMKNRIVRSPDSVFVGVIKKITNSLDDDGNEISKVEVLNSAGNSTIKLDSEIDINNIPEYNNSENSHKLEIGDVITWQLRSRDNYGTNVKLIFEKNGEKLYANPNELFKLDLKYRFIFGKIISREGDYIQVATTETQSEVYDMTYFNKIYTIKDTRDNEPETLKNMQISGNGDNILIITTWGSISLVIIF